MNLFSCITVKRAGHQKMAGGIYWALEAGGVGVKTGLDQ
jgi:hypothetical protein